MKLNVRFEVNLDFAVCITVRNINKTYAPRKIYWFRIEYIRRHKFIVVQYTTFSKKSCYRPKMVYKCTLYIKNICICWENWRLLQNTGQDTELLQEKKIMFICTWGRLGWIALGLLGWKGAALPLLPDERLVDVRDDTAAGDCRLDQSVQLFVASDGQLRGERGRIS